MAKALTVVGIEKLQPTETRREIPDGLLRGLFLILQPSGSKSWAVRYRIAGRTRKATIGSFPAMDLKTARERGAAALRAAAEGRDPGAEKMEARRAAAPDTVAAAADEFLDRHCRRHNRLNTVQAAEQAFRIYILPQWGNRSVESIGRRDVVALIDAVANSKPAAANRLRAVLSKFFAWCIERSLITTSPAAAVSKPAVEKSRDRILTDLELRAVWEAANPLAAPSARWSSF